MDDAVLPSQSGPVTVVVHTVIQTVQWSRVHSAAYRTVHYKKTLEVVR